MLGRGGRKREEKQTASTGLGPNTLNDMMIALYLSKPTYPPGEPHPSRLKKLPGEGGIRLLVCLLTYPLSSSNVVQRNAERGLKGLDKVVSATTTTTTASIRASEALRLSTFNLVISSQSAFIATKCLLLSKDML